MPRAAAKKTVSKKTVVARKSSRKKASEEMVLPVEKKSRLNLTNLKTYAKNPRLWVGVTVVILAILVYSFKGLFIAAMVNGQPVSRFSVISQLEQQNGKQVLDNLVVEALISQEAQKRNIVVTQADINSQITTIENSLKSQGMTLDGALAQQGMTRADLTEQIKLQAMLNKMVGTSSAVSDADVEKYISQNKSSLPTGLSDAQLKSQVKQQLEQQQIQDKTQAFIADLQKKAQIQYFVGY